MNKLLWDLRKLQTKGECNWLRGRHVSLAEVPLVENKEDKVPTLEMIAVFSI